MTHEDTLILSKLQEMVFPFLVKIKPSKKYLAHT